MKFSNRSFGFRPDPLVTWATITVVALSLTLASQVRAEGLGGTSRMALTAPPSGCRHLMLVSDVRQRGVRTRALRARPPCAGERRGLRTLLAVWMLGKRRF